MIIDPMYVEHVDKDRKAEVKTLGKRFVSMFVHIADHMTSMESLRDAMTLMVNVVEETLKSSMLLNPTKITILTIESNIIVDY